jgi:hypothetical protein
MDADGARGARSPLPRGRARGSPTSTCSAGASSSTSATRCWSTSSIASARRSRSTSVTPRARSRTTGDLVPRPRERPARASLEALLDNEGLRAEAAGILQEIYETREDWSRSSGARDPRRGEARRPSSGSGCCARSARVRREPRTAPARSTRRRARCARTPPTSRRAGARAARRELAGVGPARGHLLGDRREPRGCRARARLLDAARRHRRAPREGRRGGAGATTRCSRSTPPTPRRSPRWTPSTAAPSGGPTSSASFGVASSSPRTRRARGALRADGRGLREKLGQPDEAIAAYREVLSLDPASAVALTALDALFTAQSGGKSSPTTSRRSCGSPRKRRLQTRLMLRLAACARGRWPDRDGDRHLPSGARARPGTPTRSLRSSGSASCPSTSSASPRSWSRSTGSRATTEAHRRLRGAGEAQRRSEPAGRAAPPDRHALRGRRRRPRRRVRHDGARPRRGPGLEDDAARGSIASPAPPSASPTSRRSSRRLAS